jgi:hypothetical protein
MTSIVSVTVSYVCPVFNIWPQMAWYTYIPSSVMIDFKIQVSLRLLSWHSGRPQCWYYWWEWEWCMPLRWSQTARHIPSFMTIGSKIQVILSYYLNILRGCSVGITDERYFLSTPFKWTQVAWWVHTKFHENWFRHLRNITVITATIQEPVVLVLLIELTY